MFHLDGLFLWIIYLREREGGEREREEETSLSAGLLNKCLNHPELGKTKAKILKLKTAVIWHQAPGY